jgi:homoserine O-acetyltransferase
MIYMKFLLQIVVLLFLLQALAATADAQALHCRIGDLHLESGQILKNCKIVYRVYGKLNTDSSNVVIYPTWFGGQTAHIGRVVGPGKIVDTTQYFVISVAALGNGESTSPSNSRIQSGNSFPQITIRDMVHAEYKMLQKRFRFKHIHALIGGSMGSMQALEWAVQYPDFMDKVVAYVATPKLASADMLLMRIQEQIIQMAGADTSTAWANLSALTRYMAWTPDYVTRYTRAEEVDSLWQIWRKAKHTPFTLQNYLIQLRAMQQHDIFKPFGDSMAETAKHMHARVLFILSQTDHLLNPLPAQRFAKFIGAKVVMLNGNCGHLEPGCQMERVSRAITEFLKKKFR